MPMTAAQLVQLACQEAKAPGFTVQAGRFLNVLLSDMCQDYDFDLARKVTIINIGSGVNAQGPYALPADYLRAKFRDVFYTINGVPYFPVAIDIAEYDQLVQSPGLANYPTYYATNMSPTPPEMFFWPPPSGAYPVTVRYYSQMAEIASPESSSDIPWFPNQNYLLTRLTQEMMKITNDDRYTLFKADAEDILNKYLKMKDDKTSHPQNVALDRRMFKGPGRVLPNTKYLGW